MAGIMHCGTFCVIRGPAAAGTLAPWLTLGCRIKVMADSDGKHAGGQRGARVFTLAGNVPRRV